MPSRSIATWRRCCAPQFSGTARAAALHEADALEFDFAALARARGGRLRVIGNLPYNISTPLLFHLLDAAPAIVDLHVMLQREVVERMAAAPGTSDYGRLTVMLAPWVRVEQLFDVGPGAFKPPPRVWSAVARLTVRAQPAFAVSPQFRRGGRRRLLAAPQDPAQRAARPVEPRADRAPAASIRRRAAGDARPAGVQPPRAQTWTARAR